jgi:transcriptional regulator with XRE-family HTH domain
MSVSDPLHGVIQIPLAPEQNEPQVPPIEAVAFLVRSVRRLRQWKKETLADFARVSLSTVERVERGEKISAENLDRITQALGFDRGAFTTPRVRRSEEHVLNEMADEFRYLVSVPVKRLRTQAQVRDLAKCDSYCVHRPDLGSDYDGQIDNLLDWLDLTSVQLSDLDWVDTGTKLVQRRDRYANILAVVRELEERGTTVLAGILNAPQMNIPDWKVGIISATPKLSDPGAPKRKIIVVDRRLLQIDLSSVT